MSIHTTRGFTLAEVLVVAAIIAIIAAIILGPLGESRKKARDAQRVRDLAQIQSALDLYFEEHGEFPPGVVGEGRIGEGGPVDELLSDYFNEVPMDPLGPGDDEYFYYYDSWHYCTTNTEPRNIVIFANNMENPDESNSTDVCDFSDEGEARGQNARVALINRLGVDDGGEDDAAPTGTTCDTFTATPSTIDSGDSATLAWTTTNAESVTIDNGVVSTDPNDSESVSPTDTTTYTLTATGQGGDEDTCSVTVTVNANYVWQRYSVGTACSIVIGKSPQVTPSGDCSNEGDIGYVVNNISNGPCGSYRSDGGWRLNNVENDTYVCTEDVTTLPATWSFCAVENNTCTIAGTADVRYGIFGTYYYEYGASGSIPCTNAYFGDPVVGTKKVCEIFQ